MGTKRMEWCSDVGLILLSYVDTLVLCLSGYPMINSIWACSLLVGKKSEGVGCGHLVTFLVNRSMELTHNLSWLCFVV